MDEGDVVQSGGEETCDVLVKSDTGDGTFKQGDGIGCLSNTTVNMWVQGTSMVRFFDDMVPVFQQARGRSFLDVRVFGGHCSN